MLGQVYMLLETTYGMSFPPSPTQFAVPSVALIPAVIPKGGISDVSTEPEELEEEAPAEEDAAEEEVVEERPVPMVAAVAAVVTVAKVVGELPPPPP
jgi:hypothetical protein